MAVTNNANETATFAITGGDSGATNVVYRSQNRNLAGEITWTSAYTRTGPGTSAATSTTKGYYWWYCKSTLAAETVISNFVYQPITDGTDSVEGRCADAILATINALALEGAGGVSLTVVRGYVPQDSGLDYPACEVLTSQQAASWAGGTNQRDDIAIPIQVLFKNSDGLARNSDGGERFLAWSQAAQRSFSGQRLTGVDEVMRCEIEPALVLDPNAPEYQKVTSAFTVRCYTRQARGFGA